MDEDLGEGAMSVAEERRSNLQFEVLFECIAYTFCDLRTGLG